MKVAREPGDDGAWLERVAARVREITARGGAIVLPIWDTGRWDDRPFVVMDWCDATLAGWAQGQPIERRIEAARALVRAVEALHALGEVHGDLKPANVMVRASDGGLSVLLADLGAGAFTVGYAPPEQLAGGTADAGWDRFAVAATVWACLATEAPSGPLRLVEPRPPSRAVSKADREAFDRAAPGSSRIRRELEALLAPDPRRRPASLAPLAAALDGGREPRRWGRGAALVATGLVAAGGIAMSRSGECPAGMAADGAACVAADGMRAVRIGPRLFRMGGGDADVDWTGDAPARFVAVTRPFWIGDAEVTQGEWAAVTGDNPVATRIQAFDSGVQAPCATWLGHDLVGDDLPVVCVSWHEAIAYANARSVRDGLTPAYRIDGDDVAWQRDADGWRLPTEAEWELAARAGSEAPWAGAPDRDALCGWANVRDQSAPEKWTGEVACDDGAPVLTRVRRYAANGHGLYDMQGNALEWVWDWYGAYDGSAVDPAGPPSGFARVQRGASWNHVAKGVAARYASPPDTAYHTIGLRLARNAD